MTVILDANILMRLADQKAPLYPVALSAVDHLRRQGDSLRTVPQAHYEFWVVATRPVANNGLGLSIPECVQELRDISHQFPLLNDAPTLYGEWRALAEAHACSGKVAHDARYVAAMKTHGVTRILTFNLDDFKRYPGLIVLDPNTLAALATPPSTNP